MGYYMSGGYYQAGGPINWGALAQGAAQAASLFLPGIAGKAATAGVSALTGGSPLAALAGGAGVAGRKRYRRMNPLNPRALRRAYSRMNSASRWASRMFSAKRTGMHGVKPKFGRRKRRGI